MRDFLNIGSTPCDEPCVQVGAHDYAERAVPECRRFIEVIRAKLGPEPEGARLAVKAFPHDFGTYHEVVCHFDDTLPESEAYAFRCESEAPATWDEVPVAAIILKWGA